MIIHFTSEDERERGKCNLVFRDSVLSIYFTSMN
jgi:hypothetical protein